MMNKLCFVLMVALSPASLFAGETMESATTRPSSTCNFRVDKCATSVATDPSYIRFKDGTGNSGPGDVRPIVGDPSAYRSSFGFADYSGAPPQTVDLITVIRSRLSNCPEVTVSYDTEAGDIRVHYLHSTCDDCDWVVNVRNVKAEDFVWKRTSDNYSPRLGQMERRKFHTTSEQDAQKIEAACNQICAINSWTMYK